MAEDTPKKKERKKERKKDRKKKEHRCSVSNCRLGDYYVNVALCNRPSTPLRSTLDVSMILVVSALRRMRIDKLAVYIWTRSVLMRCEYSVATMLRAYRRQSVGQVLGTGMEE
jgi:hypothetical protein